MGWHSPLFSAGVLAVMLLQQVIRWSVEGQALVLFLEAIPGTMRIAQFSSGRLYLRPLPLANFSLPAPHLSAKLLQVSRVMSGAVGQT